MVTSNGHCEDYTRQYNFIRSITIDYNSYDTSFCDHMLASISEAFGIHNSIFWVLDPDKNIYSPISHSLNGDSIKEYKNKYYRVDPLYPDNILRKKVPKDIVTINDIMTYEEYEASSYYKEFVFPFGIPYYYLVIYIYYEDIIIGGISLFKTKSEGAFTKCEISILKKVVPFISKITVDYFLQDRLQTKENLYEALCNQSPSGFIAFDAQYPQVVNYINSSAKRYIAEIMYNKAVQNSVYQFIKDYILPEGGFDHFGLSKIIQSRSMKQFYLSINPNLFKNKLLVYVYIIPLDNIPNSRLSIIHAYDILTPRQREIVSCVLKGCTNEEIAEKLFISVSTVKTHLNTIYKKLNLPNRLSLCSRLNSNIENIV